METWVLIMLITILEIGMYSNVWFYQKYMPILLYFFLFVIVISKMSHVCFFRHNKPLLPLGVLNFVVGDMLSPLPVPPRSQDLVLSVEATHNVETVKEKNEKGEWVWGKYRGVWTSYLHVIETLKIGGKIHQNV